MTRPSHQSIFHNIFSTAFGRESETRLTKEVIRGWYLPTNFSMGGYVINTYATFVMTIIESWNENVWKYFLDIGQPTINPWILTWYVRGEANNNFISKTKMAAQATVLSNRHATGPCRRYKWLQTYKSTVLHTSGKHVVRMDLSVQGRYSYSRKCFSTQYSNAPEWTSCSREVLKRLPTTKHQAHDTYCIASARDCPG